MAVGEGPADDSRPTFASSVAFGLLFALVHMGPAIPPGRSWEASDIESAVAFLATLSLVEAGASNGRVVPSAELCELLRPRLSERFVEKAIERDILILFAVVVLSAQAYGEDPALWADAVAEPRWLETIVGAAVGRASRVSPETLLGRLS